MSPRSHRFLPPLAALAACGFFSFAVLSSLSPAATAQTAVNTTAASGAATSANWAGYIAQGSSDFSRVSGSWVQPAANCSSVRGTYAAFWVGLGGSSEQSGSLEQVGTQADCTSSGGASYYAWYELVPAGPVQLGLAVRPGDHISAAVTVNGSTVNVSLNNETTGASSAKTLQMANPDTSTAEWIAEAPSSCDGNGNCTPLTLANFDSVNFTNATATAAGHTGSISDSNWSSQPVQLNGDGGASLYGYAPYGYGPSGLVSDQTSAAGAQPSTLSSDGSAFTVAYQSSGTASSSGASAGAAGNGNGGSGAHGGYPGYGSGGGYPGYGGAGGYPGYGSGGGYPSYGSGGGYPGYGGAGGYPGYGSGGGYPGYGYGGYGWDGG